MLDFIDVTAVLRALLGCLGPQPSVELPYRVPLSLNRSNIRKKVNLAQRAATEISCLRPSTLGESTC